MKRSRNRILIERLFGESLNMNEVNSMIDSDDLAAHLTGEDDPVLDDEGPVPPNEDGDPHLMADPFARFTAPRN